MPLFLIIGAWIKVTSRGPILFRQVRVGLDGEEFKIYKFRSMRAGADTGVHKQHFENLVGSNVPMKKLDAIGDKRMIPGGRILRASGLDELPQIFNVIRGEMSLVGPRPCTPGEMHLYKEDQRKRFEVLPGITGYWQVKGKNGTTFNEMIELDDYYTNHCSPGLDLSIFFLTPAVLIGQVIAALRVGK